MTCEGCIRKERRCGQCRKKTRNKCCEEVVEGTCEECIQNRWKVGIREEGAGGNAVVEWGQATIGELRGEERWRVEEAVEGGSRRVMHYDEDNGWSARI